MFVRLKPKFLFKMPGSKRSFVHAEAGVVVVKKRVCQAGHKRGGGEKNNVVNDEVEAPKKLGDDEKKDIMDEEGMEFMEGVGMGGGGDGDQEEETSEQNLEDNLGHVRKTVIRKLRMICKNEQAKIRDLQIRCENFQDRIVKQEKAVKNIKEAYAYMFNEREKTLEQWLAMYPLPDWFNIP